MIALLQAFQICSVHIPGIPALGMCKYRTGVCVNTRAGAHTPLTLQNDYRISISRDIIGKSTLKNIYINHTVNSRNIKSS